MVRTILALVRSFDCLTIVSNYQRSRLDTWHLSLQHFAYACVYQWETLPVVELTPDMFINFLAKFIDFHRASEISINCVTPVSFLDCQYVQRLFEILYDSSFYSVVRKFELMDTCTHSYAASQPDSNSVEIKLRNNPVGDKQLLLYLTLSSGLVNDTVTVIVHNCTNAEHLHNYLL